ncbi:MAG: DUF4399 domain-containing protein, partial [Gemmatimonadota bacterium]
LAVLSACGGGEQESEAMPETSTPEAQPAAEAGPSVTILQPQDGDTLSGDSVVVRLAASGVDIVPAGDTVSGTGHHHLYLDEDLGQPGEAVPTIPGHVVHLGTGASEYVFKDVAPGNHRLIAVVADGMHVPLQPWVVDTVNFVVR